MFSRFIATFSLALGLSGCATIGTLQTAETNGEGQFQGAIEPAYLGYVGEGGSGGFGYFNISGRYGVSDRVDLGGRFGTAGLEFTTKFMLTDPDRTDGPIISVAPSLGGFFLGVGGGAAGIANIQVPVILGFPVGQHQFVLAPKLHTIIASAGGGGDAGVVGVASLGSSVGFAAKVGSNTRIMPELTVVVPVVAGAASTGDGENQLVSGFSDGAILQISVGFLFGGRQSSQAERM